MRVGGEVMVEPHRHEGAFIAKGEEDGSWCCIIRRKSVQNEDGTKTEYRVWNPFRYKLAASILGGVDDVWIESFIHEIAPGSSGRKQGLPNPFPSNIEKNCLGGWILNRS